MILVTGATGNIGTHVVHHLAEHGAPTRIISRDPAKAKRLPSSVEVVRADLDQPDTLEAAFRGIDKLVLIAPGPNVPAQDAALITAAERAKVAHVVMVTSLGIELGGIAGGKPHMAGEKRLRESALRWTVLHPSEFMTNALWWSGMIKTTGSIFAPTGAGKIGFIDPADIGAVAAKVITTAGHEGRTYRLTGPVAITTADIATELGEILGRPVRHIDVSEDAYRAGALEAGTPPPVIDMMTEYYEAVRAGRVDIVTRDIPELLGRPAHSFADWAREHVHAFR
jgi:uncharacterized protein YbjT (DUF2867 family)